MAGGGMDMATRKAIKRRRGELEPQVQLLAFPAHCPQCGQCYASFDDYLHDTTGGVVEAVNGGSMLTMQARRDCRCGTSLGACLTDRRSTEPLRASFDFTLSLLAEQGLRSEDVRIELRQVIRGEPGALLGWLYQPVMR